MFVGAFILISAIAVPAALPAAAAEPAAKAEAKASPKVTEADRDTLNAVLVALEAIEARARERFDQHEMTKKELRKLRDLTEQMMKIRGFGVNCIPSCSGSDICCRGKCEPSCPPPYK